MLVLTPLQFWGGCVYSYHNLSRKELAVLCGIISGSVFHGRKTWALEWGLEDGGGEDYGVIPAPLLAYCVFLGRFPSLSESQFTPTYNEDSDRFLGNCCAHK